MSIIQILLNSDDQHCFAYRICGQQVISNKKLSSLSAFAIPITDKHVQSFGEHKSPMDEEKRVLFAGVSWLAEKYREIICYRSVSGYLVDVPQISAFFISRDGRKISQLPDSQNKTELTQADLENILLGPVLMLALARIHLFGLHASSIQLENKAIIFTGDSGFGKSTIVDYLQNETEFKWTSDDISVISGSQSGFMLHADFPQLKLKGDCQIVGCSTLLLGGVIMLNRQPEINEINLISCGSIEAVQVMLNHGVAVQLFDKTLANQHLKFMVDLSAMVPVYKLTYPNGRDAVSQIAIMLKSEFN